MNTTIINNIRTEAGLDAHQFQINETSLKRWNLAKHLVDAALIATLVGAVVAAFFAQPYILMAVAGTALLLLIAKGLIEWKASSAQKQFDSEKSDALDPVVAKIQEIKNSKVEVHVVGNEEYMPLKEEFEQLQIGFNALTGVKVEFDQLQIDFDNLKGEKVRLEKSVKQKTEEYNLMRDTLNDQIKELNKAQKK